MSYNIIARKHGNNKAFNLRDEENEPLLFNSEDLALNYLRKLIKNKAGEKLKYDSEGTIIRYISRWNGIEHLDYYNIDLASQEKIKKKQKN